MIAVAHAFSVPAGLLSPATAGFQLSARRAYSPAVWTVRLEALCVTDGSRFRCPFAALCFAVTTCLGVTGARYAAGISSRSPAVGDACFSPFAAAMLPAAIPYCLPIEASVSPLVTLCIRQDARLSAGIICSEAESALPEPLGICRT